MTTERREHVLKIIRRDTNEQLLKRYTWYCDNFNPLDDERCEDFEIIKAEVLNRMRRD